MRNPLGFGWALAAVFGALVPLSTAKGADELLTYCGTDRWQGIIQEAAARSHMDAAWIDTVIRVESAGCEFLEDRPTTSKAGAMGLMQLMPSTWKAMRQRLSLGGDPYDPHDNILAGTEWLEELHERYGTTGFLAAYHAGPERYEDFLAGRAPLPEQTLNYIARVEEALLRMHPGSSALADIRVERTPFVHSYHSPAPVASPPVRSPFVTLMHARQAPPQPATTLPNHSEGERSERAHDAP